MNMARCETRGPFRMSKSYRSPDQWEGAGILIGIAVMIGTLLPVAKVLISEFPAGEVAHCVAYRPSRSGWVVEIAFKDGRKSVFDPLMLSDRQQCVRLKTMIEKRKWSLEYQVDSRSHAWADAPSLLTIAGIGAALASVSWLTIRRQR